MDRPNLPEASRRGGRERRRWAITPEELAILVDLFGGRLAPFGTEEATRFPLRGCRARLVANGDSPAPGFGEPSLDDPSLQQVECEVVDISMRAVGAEFPDLPWPTGTLVTVEILHPALQPRRWSTCLTEWSLSVSGRRRATLRFEPPPALPS